MSKRARSTSGKKPPAKKQVVRQNAGLQMAATGSYRATEEQKNIDVSQINTLVFGTATAVKKLLNPCAQGTTTVTRAGRRTTMVSMTYALQASLAPTTTGASPIRLVIVYDRQANGAAPATIDVFAADQIETPMNLDNSRRFKVLVDEIHDGMSTAGPASLLIKGFRDFTGKGRKIGLPCEFKNTSAGDITDINTGSIYSFVWSNGGFGTASPTNSFYTRVRFTDA